VKRGQITLFVIIGILLIAIIGFGLYLSREFAKAKSVRELAETVELSETELEAKHIMEACMYDLLSNGILEVFAAGGTLEDVKRVSLNAPVYDKELPKLNSILDNIASYIDDNMETCIDKNSRGLSVRRPGKTEVDFKNGNARAQSNVQISLENSVLKDFDASVDADLDKVLEDANELYREEKDTGRFVAMGNRSLSSLKKDYLLYSESTGEEKVYLMRFKDVLIENRQLEFVFAIPIEERTMVAGVNITEVDTGIFAGIASSIEDMLEGLL